MGNQGAFIRVGLLVFAGIGLAVALVWFLGGQRFSQGTLLESYFTESVQGLEVGAPVKYRGVTVGRVTETGLVSAEYNLSQTAAADMGSYRLVFVRYVVDRAKIGRALNQGEAVQLGLRARLASQGITGLSYIELDFVNADRYPARPVPWTPRAEIIPSMPSTLAQVQDAGQQLLATLNKLDLTTLIASANGLLIDLRQQTASGEAHQVLVQMTALLQTLRDAVQTADVPGLAADLRRTADSLRDTVESKDTRRLLSGTAQAADQLARATAQLPALIAGLQSTTRRADNSTADVQQALVPLLRDMQATAQNLRETTDALRRYPAGLLGPPPPRTAEPAR